MSFARVLSSLELACGSELSCSAAMPRPGTVRITMVGRLDLTSAEQARRVLRDAQRAAGQVICDLAEVSFVDVSGLHVLLDSADRARLQGARLSVIHHPASLRRLLEVLGPQARLGPDEAWIWADAPVAAAAAPSPPTVAATSVANLAGAASRATRRRAPGRVDGLPAYGFSR